MKLPVIDGREVAKSKPFDREVFDAIVAAVDSLIPMKSGSSRARAHGETFSEMWGLFDADVVSGWPENSELHQRVNFLLRDDGVWIRPAHSWESSDSFFQWKPLASVERMANAKSVLPFPFDGTDLALYLVRGPGAFIMDMLLACLDDAEGDVEAAVRLMVPVQPHEPVLDENARRALVEAWRVWEVGASSVQRDPSQAAEDSAADLAFAGQMVRALHSMHGTAVTEAKLRVSTQPAPVPEAVAPAPDARRAKLLEWFEEEVKAHGKHGAVQRVANRAQMDRGNCGKAIRKARSERDEARRDGVMYRGLVE